ncbi:2'-5' RNA ligase [Desulfarculus baarsii DSM 2075]|uniref:RNA 2',3'-cyclic phosphodiesterase n=1 Tax=Desulfarculus baarsii (strain ATCC 33931 / DSM 2075 / LMG 7858 / VKM B-1802 / 2st14) TaxID=644282 RepID=E1QIT7_DESB2|nr:2'-5' RNA ligase [Desulfarculus baarsii DSM 2075]
MRLFVALELPAAVKDHARAVIDRLRGAGADVKWLDAATMHVTLKFMGEVDQALLGDVRRALAGATAGFGPLELRVGGCGVFPSPRRPNVVWLGIDGQAQRLAALAGRVDQALAQATGLPREKRPFTPHLTIGRVRQGRGSAQEALSLAVGALAELSGPAFQARAARLVQSTLTPRGAIHKPIDEYPLA